MNLDINITMNIKENAKRKPRLNTMPQMGMERCPFAGYRRLQINGRGPPLDDAPQDLQRKYVKFVIPQVNPADVRHPDEAAMSR
jgi:hypothetical protein